MGAGAGVGVGAGVGAEAGAGEGLVVPLGVVPEPVQGLAVHGVHHLGVAGNGPGGVEGVPVVADGGVQQQGQPCKKDQY